MGLFIGMDEAGYGPSLGPLVISVTVWEVPGQPRNADLWTLFEPAVCRERVRGDDRVHVADSKQVHSAARGIGALERSVLAGLGLMGARRDSPPQAPRLPGTFEGLLECLGTTLHEAGPWFERADLPLPRQASGPEVVRAIDRWRACCTAAGVQLRAIRSDVVPARRFNKLLREWGGKGMLLSRLSLRLLRAVWDPDGREPALVIADKHGGRNRYDELLAEVLQSRMIFRGRESTERSDYRVGRTALQFRTRGESELPVALASLVSKYVRELAMQSFNRFWGAHVPGLKPTKGYVTDARRFRRDIASAQRRLGIADADLWRER